jgi:sugar lactone lactonase YvrE
VRYSLTGHGLSDGETFAPILHGLPDGIAFDRAGNLYVAVVRMDGERTSELQVFDPNGVILDRWRPATSALLTNIAIDSGGSALVTDTENHALLQVDDWAQPGLPLYPFREYVQQTA